jgi:hypothetical protein
MGLSRRFAARQLAGLTESQASDTTLPDAVSGALTTVPVLALRFPDAAAVSGMSRSTLYRHAAAGRLILRKSGSTTLVDAESLRQLVINLPVLSIVRAELPASKRLMTAQRRAPPRNRNTAPWAEFEESAEQVLEEWSSAVLGDGIGDSAP